jgi:hypothetical protein
MMATITLVLSQEQKKLLMDAAREDTRTASGFMRIFIQDCLPAYRAKLESGRMLKFKGVQK